MADYEIVIALGVMKALEASTLTARDPALLKACALSDAEELPIRPRDTHRADTFLAVQRLRTAADGMQSHSERAALLAEAKAAANAWVEARS